MKGKIARSAREMPSGISILLLGVAYFKGEGFPTCLRPREDCRFVMEVNTKAGPEEDLKTTCACSASAMKWLSGAGHRSGF